MRKGIEVRLGPRDRGATPSIEQKAAREHGEKPRKIAKAEQ
jgi:hypothetical protein